MNSLVYLLLSIIFISLARAGISAAPWLPTRKRDITRIKKILTLKPSDVFVDLGCGDGRIVQAIASEGISARGYEISFLTYLHAHIYKFLVKGKGKIHLQSLWRASISDATIIYAFLHPRVMKKVYEKISSDITRPALFISNTFQVPDIIPKFIDTSTVDTLYVYEIK